MKNNQPRITSPGMSKSLWPNTKGIDLQKLKEK
jgi:hypothetical protein